MQVKLNDLLPNERLDLEGVVGEYARLHARFLALEERRLSVEKEVLELTSLLEVARAREASLKAAVSARIGEEVELLLPLPA
jgi:predicted  nucleic acid-binding Zn-ribbon protein